jgi:hypothetical protein
MLVQVREYYQTAAGAWAPTKKGLALSPDALRDLASSAAAIIAALPEGAAAPPTPRAAAPAGPRGGAAGGGSGGGAAASGGAAGGGASGGGAAGGGAADFVDLGGRKRARLNVFNNRKLIDLREFYEARGVEPGAGLPGAAAGKLELKEKSASARRRPGGPPRRAPRWGARGVAGGSPA